MLAVRTARKKGRVRVGVTSHPDPALFPRTIRKTVVDIFTGNLRRQGGVARLIST